MTSSPNMLRLVAFLLVNLVYEFNQPFPKQERQKKKPE
jgi:hypothetical protein